MTPDAPVPTVIDESFVPVTSPSTVEVRVRDETILFDLATNNVHTLNAIASLIWMGFDGHASLAQVGRELSSAFPGTDRDRILEDVMRLAIDLEQQGLIENTTSVSEAQAAEPPERDPADEVDTRFLEDPPNP